MIVRPWQRGDTERLNIQPAQQYMRSVAPMEADLTPLSEAGLAFTGLVDDKPIIMAGLVHEWPGRATAWAVVGADAGPHFAAIHRAAHHFLVRAPYRRIEAHVDVGFEAGVRWVKMLGFEMEAYLRAFRPDGADMLQFVRIRS